MKRLGLKIEAEPSCKHVNYLDVTLDLETCIHKPYRKPNAELLYVNAQSDHPPTILKHIPATISKRISTLSSNEDVFARNASSYNQALKTSGYKEKIVYSVDNKNRNRKNRKRKITWFNPPFSQNVKTNIGKQFLKLVDRHFPPGHSLHRIFNRKTLKISYSCMPNMNTIIKAHNARVIRPTCDETSTVKTNACNCRKKQECPLRGSCLVNSIVYKATVTSSEGEKMYIGNTGDTFKSRYSNHTLTFRNEKYSKRTELSKYIWSLKRKNTQYNIKWEIVKKSNTQMRQSGLCNLCMDEKLEILRHKREHKDKSINKRSELISTCRHRKKLSTRKRKKVK